MTDNIDVKKITSKVLAIRVVLYRVFGMDKELSLLCMKELAVRRENGDNFNYENFIDEEIKKFPKPNTINLSKVIKSMRKVIK